MDWNYWLNKRVFVQLKSGGYYNGKVVDVDTDAPPIIFLTVLDKFGKKVIFVQSEIVKIVEEDVKKEGENEVSKM